MSEQSEIDGDEYYYRLGLDQASPSGRDSTWVRLPEGYVIVPAELERQAELGRAWERVEAVLPEGWSIFELTTWGGEELWTAYVRGPDGYRSAPLGRGPTPAAALNALADALEAKG